MNWAISLRDLEYVVALYKHRHFAKAAETCFISQSTLSLQVKKVEQQLGVQLFERDKKSVHVTEAGERLYPQMQKILKEANGLIDQAKMLANPYALPLRLGIIPTLSSYLLPLLMPGLRQEKPELKLYILEGQTEDILRKLTDGDLDAVLVALPIIISDLETISLFHEPFYLTIPKGHALEQAPIINNESLRSDKVLLLEEGHCLRDQAIAFCGEALNDQEEDFRATSLETLAQMVAANLGITLLPKLATLQARPGLVYRAFHNDIPEREIGLVFRPTYPHPAVMQEFAKVIQEKVAGYLK